MDYGIKGKVAVITGTGRQGAMGHTIAKTLAGEGVNVACVDVNIEGAEAIAEELRGMGVNAKAYNIDQSEYEQVKEGAAEIAAEMGPVDILVNNAALLRGGGRIQKTTVDDWKNLLRIDLDGP
jgi:NAD(P)-dependent dehydrogenase (short-subunit alcohol dehydrogenase family)